MVCRHPISRPLKTRRAGDRRNREFPKSGIESFIQQLVVSSPPSRTPIPPSFFPPATHYTRPRPRWIVFLG